MVAAVCAAALAVPDAGGASPGRTTDYLTDTAANYDASSLAQAMTPGLVEQPGFAGVRIASAGVEIATVGPPAASLLTGVNAASAAAVRPVSVYYRRVLNSNLVLTRASTSIGQNFAFWTDRGVHISGVGPDPESNSVSVFLSSYSSEAAALLEAAFPGVVTVERGSRSFSVSSCPSSDGSPADYLAASPASPGMCHSLKAWQPAAVPGSVALTVAHEIILRCQLRPLAANPLTGRLWSRSHR